MLPAALEKTIEAFKEYDAERKLYYDELVNKIKETLPDITKNHLEKYKADVKAIIGNIK